MKSLRNGYLLPPDALNTMDQRHHYELICYSPADAFAVIVGSDFGQLKYPIAAQLPEGCARTAADGEPLQRAGGSVKTSVLAIGLVSRCLCARTDGASS